MGAAGTRHAQRQMCAHSLSCRPQVPERLSGPLWPVADEPSLHLGPGPRANDRARRASRKQICRWLWGQEPSGGVGMLGSQKGAHQHVYFGEGLPVGLLSENCLVTADEILSSVCLYKSMSSVKTGTPWVHFIITSTQPLVTCR